MRELLSELLDHLEHVHPGYPTTALEDLVRKGRLLLSTAKPRAPAMKKPTTRPPIPEPSWNDMTIVLRFTRETAALKLTTADAYALGMQLCERAQELRR